MKARARLARAPLCRPRALALAALSLLVLALVAGPGAAVAEGSSAAELEALQAEVAALKARLAELEQRLDAVAGGPGDAPPAPAATPGSPAPTPVAAAADDAATGESWEVGYRANGGGFVLRSPDGRVMLRQLGYVQSTAAIFHDDFERPDAPGDFSLRRARLDWFVDFGDEVQLFVEIDGGPGSVPGSSDFALVVAQLQFDLVGDDLRLTAGKFITPFSDENLLSSRSLDTVERYIALNSMFLLPGLDVQYGLMASGRLLANDRFEYAFGVFNGNGRANDNLSDDNGSKEVQLKLGLQATPELHLGLGFDHSREEAQSLQLRGLSFTPWVALPVRGERFGVTADFEWKRGRAKLRGEGLYFDFDDAGATLSGGFVQASRFLRGDAVQGIEALLRAETAGLGGAAAAGLDGDRIDALTAGLNLFYRGNTRFQLDLVAERYDGLSNLPLGASRVEGEGWKPYLLTQLQLKF